MPIRVYDHRADLANLIVHPAIRSRFRRVEPGPAPRMHSHDIAGEIFIVLAGRCEFLIEDEAVTLTAGQLLYVEPKLRHALHAVGDEECIIYLSVTPHVEPTHTLYDADDNLLPPQYGTWRGTEPDPQPDTSTADLAEAHAVAAERLADIARRHADAVRQRRRAVVVAADTGDQPTLKALTDESWFELRDLLIQLDTLELAWNHLAPRAMPGKTRG